MSVKTTRATGGQGQRSAGRFGAVVALVVMAVSIVAAGHGFSAAARERTAITSADAVPVVLAGRWKGPRYSFNARAADAKSCGGKPCELTYDIVPCPDGWCGIAVSDETPCGAIAVHLKPEAGQHRNNAFTGNLELAKGAAPYTVEAWYSPPGQRQGEGREQAHLNFVGDTGSGLLMMRRSFPFQAELARVSDAQCTPDKATS